jgi:hypothetical protein
MVDYWETINDKDFVKSSVESPDAIIVSVSKIPRNKLDASRHAPYMFAIDQHGNQIHIRQEIMEFGDLLWDDIDVGDLLEIQVDAPVESDAGTQKRGNSITALSAKYRG